MDENDKLGTIVIDGKVTNLDTIDIQELVRLGKELERQIYETRKEIDELIEQED